MPVISFAHSKFWLARPNPVVEPPPSFGGYPLWQSSIIVGSLFGVLQAWWDRVKYSYRWYRAAWSWTADQRRAFEVCGSPSTMISWRSVVEPRAMLTDPTRAVMVLLSSSAMLLKVIGIQLLDSWRLPTPRRREFVIGQFDQEIPIRIRHRRTVLFNLVQRM